MKGASLIFVPAVVSLSYLLSQFLLSIGLNKRVYNHAPGECNTVGTFEEGISDLDTSREGLVFVSTGLDLRNRTNTTRHGAIFVYNQEDKSAWELTYEGGKLQKLNPEGISLSVGSEKEQRLFVVNHRKYMDTVEVFAVRQNAKRMDHEHTIRSPLFSNLKDVAGVDGKRFFVTVHTYFSNAYLKGIERYLSLRYGSVLFYNGNTVVSVDRKIATPTGIVFDRIRRVLYVGSLTGERLHVYRVLNDYSIMDLKTVPLNTSPQMMWMDIDSTLIATCHPVLMRYLHHETDPSQFHSPSQVLRLHVKPFSNKTTRIDQLYANDGASINGATVSLRTGDSLLIGGPHTTLLTCQMPPFRK